MSVFDSMQAIGKNETLIIRNGKEIGRFFAPDHQQFTTTLVDLLNAELEDAWQSQKDTETTANDSRSLTATPPNLP